MAEANPHVSEIADVACLDGAVICVTEKANGIYLQGWNVLLYATQSIAVAKFSSKGSICDPKERIAATKEFSVYKVGRAMANI